jgi:inosose dehydratase
MRRRELLAAMSAALAASRERAGTALAAIGPNLKWAVSIGLWNDQPPTPFTDMLDVLKDTGFDGFRMTGFPGFLDQHNLTESSLEKELSKRDLHIATLSFGGPADDVTKHAEIDKAAHQACRFLKQFGATELVVFSPRRLPKNLVREHLRVSCEYYNHLGELCADYGIRAGLHNHSQGQLVESQDEVELMLRLTDPKRFHWAPDTIHLYLGGSNVVELFEKYNDRLIFMDFVDGKYTFAREDVKLANGVVHKAGSEMATFLLSNYDLGEGEIDFPALTRILERRQYKGWICVDHHYARVSPRYNFGRCMKYIRETLAPIYS